jgi:hypothetical protein
VPLLTGFMPMSVQACEDKNAAGDSGTPSVRAYRASDPDVRAHINKQR